MSSDRTINKQKRINIVKGFLGKRDGRNGDINILEPDRAGIAYLCVKLHNEWKSVKLSDIKEHNIITANRLIVEEDLIVDRIVGRNDGFLHIGSDIKTPNDIYLRNSKIYFDSSATTPNEYITGGNNFLNFYAGGNNVFNISSTQAIVGDGYSLTVNAGDKLYLDGDSSTGAGVDTYISESAGNTITLNCGTGIGGGSNDILTATASSVAIDGAFTVAAADVTNSITSTNATQLSLKYDGSNYVNFNVASDGEFTIETTGTDDDFLLNVDGDIVLDSGTGKVKFYYAGDTDDLCQLQVGANGATTFLTTDSDGAVGHLTFDVDGDINLDPDTGITKFSYGGTNDVCTLTVAADNGATTIATLDASTTAGHLTLDPDGDLIITTDPNTGQVTIDKNSTNTAMQIDLDHTGISASGQTITNVGLDLDINCESVTHIGTVNQTGIDIDLVSAADGTQTNTGISIDVDGGDTNTGLYIDTAGTHIKLAANADPVTDYATIAVADTGDLTIATFGDGTTLGTMKLDAAGDIIIDADGGNIDFRDANSNRFRFYMGTDQKLEISTGNFTIDSSSDIILDANSGVTKFYLAGDTDDLCTLTVAANGATTITTADSDGAVGHLKLQPDGDLLLKPVTYTYSAFPIGFTQDEPTFNDTDTIVLFSTKGNKAKLTLTNNCTDIHFKFPAVSGNFVCVLLQDGTGGRTISNWKTQDSAGNAGAGNSGLVLWAGGTAPSNTETADKADIVSFYWDADNEIAYGTYTYNF